MFRKLTPEQQLQFLAARSKDTTSSLDTGAPELMTLEESVECERRNPECVLDCLWTERWKNTDEHKLMAKS